ncbi:MBL fold metallo-hydrolase [Enterobacter sp. 168J2]|uniref:MBL fold metallo-hydrolase n=1 Tax=Enterobacter sp. 168J2 TaxID=3077758 RepID=UPI0009B3BBC3|nr:MULTISPECIES: MBL fold metallo-hydrolase [Enterobacter]EJC0565082.1 MBL fold metallo-hydrolase [Enterobacter cloacae]MCP1114365.1 MBL fold metallo-hydrolase [Enterobacter bugandensis]HBU6129581.1 MBL fold metallo-hydrolase [Enterobacter cloacae]
MVWKNPWYDPSLKHHTPNGFRNTTSAGHQPGDLDRWRKERKEAGLPKPPALGYDDFIRQWWQPADLQQPQEDGAWWLGHASILLQLDGNILLTDPVFSRRASPLPFLGPQRRTPPALSVDQLHQLDAVVISHNHYDHLDEFTVRHILKRFPDVSVFVPLGLGGWFRRRGAKKVVELDWWQSFTWQGMTLTAVPAQHWSMRTLWNRNRSLWCGWVFEGRHHRFWFSGDTGYSPELLLIPERLGKIDAAALPVGAYAPRWFMAVHHMDPQSAVALWQQLGCPLAFPVHWGVFELADEALDDPIKELTDALDSVAPVNNPFRILKIGEYLSL